MNWYKITQQKKTIQQIAEEVRKNMVHCYDDNCLQGICLDVAKELAKELQKNGYKAQVVQGTFTIDEPDSGYYEDWESIGFGSEEEFEDAIANPMHYWVEVDGIIVDLTAIQFNDELSNELEYMSEIVIGPYMQFPRYKVLRKGWAKNNMDNIKIAQKNSKKLIVMRSPGSSGKSTLAKQLGAGGIVLSSDDFFMKEGKYVFDVNLLGYAHKWNQNRTEEAMQKGISPIVIDNTNTKLVECRKYLELGLKYGYKIEFVSPNWSPNLKTKEGKWNTDFLMQLQQNKDRKDINKTIPKEVIERQVNRFEYQLPNETKEQFIQRILSS